MSAIGVPDRERNGNGNGVSWRFLGTLAIGAVIAIGGWAWTSTATEVVRLRDQIEQRSERLAVVEAVERSQQEQLIELKTDLKNFSDKLDAALSRNPATPSGPTFPSGYRFDK